jgi:hypothetical protein
MCVFARRRRATRALIQAESTAVIGTGPHDRAETRMA